MSVNSDLLLDTANHDLVIDGYVLQITEGLTATAQRLKVRLKLFLGEWFLGINDGVPYYEDILVKNPDLELIKADFRQQIMTVPTVVEMLRLTVVPDYQARRLYVDFAVRTTDDDSVELELTLP